VDVLAPAQPSSPHAAALQVVSERSFDDLGAASHCRLADGGAQAIAVGVDGVPRLRIAVPAQDRRAGSAIRVFQTPPARSFSTAREW